MHEVIISDKKRDLGNKTAQSGAALAEAAVLQPNGLNGVHEATAGELGIAIEFSSNIQPQPINGRQGEQERAGHSFFVYDSFGNLSNPSEPGKKERYESERRRIFREATAGLSIKERQLANYVVPKIVRVLRGNPELVNKVYERDLTNLDAIALDWFLHPDTIDQTQIMIGNGGTTEVNARLPSYFVGAFKTVEDVKKVYADYKNYALLNNLHDQLPDRSRAGEVDSFIAQQLRRQHKAKNPGAKEKTDQEYLGEISEFGATIFTPQEIKDIVENSYEEFLGHTPDNEILDAKYHVATKLPKVVVFNASHAAIRINGEDEESTLRARDMSQELLKKYVEVVHPDLVGSVEFQNDRPWSEHDLYTKMLLGYTHDLIDGANGHTQEALRRLEQFAKHHGAGTQTIHGVAGYRLYADMHPHFFQDPQETKGPERIPTGTIMEPRTPARHVLYDQNDTEITSFGVFRKAFSERANLTDFLEWLHKKHALTEQADIDVEKISDQVTQLMQEGDASKGSRDFRSYVWQALNKHYPLPKAERGQAKAPPSYMRRIITELLDGDDFKLADNTDQQTLWEQFRGEAELAKQSNNPDDLHNLIEDLKARRALISEHTKQMDLAIERGDAKIQGELAQKPEALTDYPLTKVERGVTFAHNPPYYKQEADVTLWPKAGLPTLEGYNDHTQAVQNRLKRLRGTTGTASKLLDGPERQTDGLLPLERVGLQRLCQQALANQELQANRESYSSMLRFVYQEVDELEANGYDPEVVMAKLKERMSQFASIMKLNVEKTTGLEGGYLDHAALLFTSGLVEEVNRGTVSDALVGVSKAEAIRRDYMLILSDVNPNVGILSDIKNDLLAKLSRASNGQKTTLEEQLIAVDAGLKEQLKAAEHVYHTLIIGDLPAYQ